MTIESLNPTIVIGVDVPNEITAEVQGFIKGDPGGPIDVAAADGYVHIGMPENLVQLRSLPVPVISPGRTFTIPVGGHTDPRDGGEGNWYWQYNSNEEDDYAMVIKPDSLLSSQPGRYKRSYSIFIWPEMFGGKCNFNWDTQQGSVDTIPNQKMFNWANKTGDEVKLRPGKKSLTDTIYLHYDAVLNPNWPGRGGRTKIAGQANGHATGALEGPGCAFVHVNNSPKPLLQVKGIFDIAVPDGMAGYFSLEDFNLVGGNQTTDVLRIQGAQGSIFLKNYTVKVQNPSGNGITEATTWETTHINGLIRGGASGLGTWTGTGLNICSDGTTGQINMKTYINVNIYKNGHNIRIGRGNELNGTFGPIVFIGGQTAWADQIGMTLGGGILGFTSIGQQHEQARLNGIKIDSAGANDLPRQIKIMGGYITECGKIQDGSYDEFAIHCVDGVNVEIDEVIIQNARSGIAYDQSKCSGFLVRRPYFKTITPYGQAFGRGTEAYGAFNPANRIKIDNPIFDANFSVNKVDPDNGLAITDAGGRISTATLSATPSISLGGNTNAASARILNFNHASAQIVTAILGGTLYQELICTFSTLNTTLQNNGSTIHLNGSNFTPTSLFAVLRLFQARPGVWVELFRSQSA